MSLRQQAKILGTSHANLSRMISGKRKWNPQLKARYDVLVGTTLVPVGGNAGTSEHGHHHAPYTQNTPHLATKSMYNMCPSQCGAVAHLGERFNGIEEVESSSLSSSTINLFSS